MCPVQQQPSKRATNNPSVRYRRDELLNVSISIEAQSMITPLLRNLAFETPNLPFLSVYLHHRTIIIANINHKVTVKFKGSLINGLIKKPVWWTSDGTCKITVNLKKQPSATKRRTKVFFGFKLLNRLCGTLLPFRHPQ